MKRCKFIISALASLLLATATMAQQPDFESRKEIGLSGGVTFSTLTTYDEAQKKLIDGAFVQGSHASLFYKYAGERNLGVIIEASYDQLGYKMVDGSVVNLDYLSTPILTHIYIGRKPSHFFINLGPELSFLLKETGESVFGKVERKSVFGLCGGLGYNKTFKKSKVGIEYRYHFTVTSNNKTGGTEAERRNAWMGVSLLYSFSLK